MATPTPAFPAAIATDAQLKVANNLVQTTLKVSAAATDTILFVNSVTGFVANALVSIDSEIVSIASVTAGGNPQLVVAAGGRGFDGTTAATHSPGAKVSMLIDAWHHNALSSEIKAIEQALGPNLSNIARSSKEPIAISTDYDFAPLSPGGSLAAGAVPITLNPIPAGIAVGGSLYISGGAGAAEAVQILGWNPTSGQVVVQTTTTHSGAWTIQSATQGIQEAVVSLGSAGGEVHIPKDSTLQANVVNLGVANILIKKFIGVTVSGAYTLFGYNAALTGRAEFETAQPAFDNTVPSASKIGSQNGANPVQFYQHAQEQSNLVAVDGVDGVVTIPQSSTQWEGCGVFGGVQNASTTTNGVAGRFYAEAIASGPDSSHQIKLWGINTLMKDGSAATHYQNVLLLNEWDFNINDPTTNLIAHSIGGASSVKPASSIGFLVNNLGGAGASSVKWDAGFQVLDGTCSIGLEIGTTGGNNAASQPIYFWSRSSTGTGYLCQLQSDSLGNFQITGSSGVVFTAGGVPSVCTVTGNGITMGSGKYMSYGVAATGSGSAALGANSPATVPSAPYTWIKCQAPDGTIVYIPAWK